MGPCSDSRRSSSAPGSCDLTRQTHSQLLAYVHDGDLRIGALHGRGRQQVGLILRTERDADRSANPVNGLDRGLHLAELNAIAADLDLVVDPSEKDLHRPHRALDQSAPLHPAPEPISGTADIVDLNVRRRDRLGDILHEHEHAA